MPKNQGETPNVHPQAPSGASHAKSVKVLPLWTLIVPFLGLVAYLAHLSYLGLGGVIGAAVIMMGCVLAAVHHAEVVAHRVGEPFGTLVLAIAVTIIEVSLIVSLMLSGSGDTTTLARDTVFAAIMIIINGIVGLCLLVGGVRHHEQRFVLKGVSSALCVLAAMASLSLVLPNFTSTVAGPFFSPSQLIFVAVVSLILYGAFVLVQTVRHRDYFLPSGEGDLKQDDHAAPPTLKETWIAFGVLIVALIGVVLLAKSLSSHIEKAVIGAGLPLAVVGVLIAALVLAPESLAAIKAARRNRLQTSLNLALGSALATIGLTIPAVAVLSVFMGWPLSLGLDTKSMVLLLLSFIVSIFSLGTGRTTVLQGVTHLVIFATYLFVTIVP
ncbi:calcium:proton antiporter [Asticcacaulis sp. AND118]|uniref:calcium:proton antiporter n=1 Tax=Asticcacaulis sp. AND118 TaxID=2840468 RepID=UPI001D0016B0|nr:calcium:proton antiporter [Asticcacaulis sp. AND118]UDF02887.1 calcium:proton antiporter [Asticcacaulis sp. AND118]